LYKSGAAQTPNVERMAKEGVIFNNAYSNAPVSSAARSTIMTGCYATRLGVGFHRRIQSVDLPQNVKLFPYYLKQNGYYTTNSKKTDYNFNMTPGAWDNSSASKYAWRDRAKGSPFFHIYSTAGSHESCLHFDRAAVKTKPTKFNPKDVKLAPIHKDTELMRYTYATFYDRITETDTQLGELIGELKKDSLLDNTFIFYFGDNGGALPGTKGYTTELGVHVPLVVYVPKAWRDKLDIPIGGRVDGFVSFIDFAPTLLKLAGIKVPKSIDGKAFLGEGMKLKKLNSRDEVYNYGERFDEMYAFTRTLRKGNFKYVRNFQGYGPRSIHTFYRYKMPAFVELESLYRSGELNMAQSQFFKTQGGEELYDLAVDPYQTNNLASKIEYAKLLKELRAKLKHKMVSLPDIGFYPECQWLDGIKTSNTPTIFTAANKKNIARYADVAELGVVGYDVAKKKIAESLADKDPVVRYWALAACCQYDDVAKDMRDAVCELLADERGFVRSKAIVFNALLGNCDVEKSMNAALKIARSDAEILFILNDAVYLHDVLGIEYVPSLDMSRKYIQEIGWRLEYLGNKNIADR
ncbi:MAG: sulfatase-like hydrolase/transferase, partial [Rikenellaceae bacterium]